MKPLDLFFGVSVVDHILPRRQILVIAYSAEEFLHLACRVVNIEDLGLLTAHRGAVH